MHYTPFSLSVKRDRATLTLHPTTPQPPYSHATVISLKDKTKDSSIKRTQSSARLLCHTTWQIKVSQDSSAVSRILEQNTDLCCDLRNHPEKYGAEHSLTPKHVFKHTAVKRIIFTLSKKPSPFGRRLALYNTMQSVDCSAEVMLPLCIKNVNPFYVYIFIPGFDWRWFLLGGRAVCVFPVSLTIFGLTYEKNAKLNPVGNYVQSQLPLVFTPGCSNKEYLHGISHLQSNYAVDREVCLNSPVVFE